MSNPNSTPATNDPQTTPCSSQSSASSSQINHVNRMINPNYSRSPSRTIYSDRFIPTRTGSNFALFEIPPVKKRKGSEEVVGSGSMYTTLLKSALFGPATPDKTGPLEPLVNRNIFRFKSETKLPMHSLSPFGFDDVVSGNVVRSPVVKAPRKVAKSAYKILDAPALQDDFYLNLVDWSSLNVLAVGLGNCVYLWNPSTSKVTMLCDLGEQGVDDSVCSVSWAQRGSHLAIGTSSGKLQLWDASRCKQVRTMEGHSLRVGALAWSSTLLSSCSRDKTILHRDIRAQEDFVSKLTGHKSEVCGLKWSYDNRELASGGNDNKLFVWNQHSTRPVHKFTEHTAAVKAIAWSPHAHGLLASGGGTADRCIRFWNTTTNSRLSCVDTGSQVCNLAWSKNVNEIVSTHGYSQNQIIIWKYPTMSKVTTLTGHSFRVLYLAVSPDGQTIVTGAGDETLRFWNVFPSAKSQNRDNDLGATSRGRTVIR